MVLEIVALAISVLALGLSLSIWLGAWQSVLRGPQGIPGEPGVQGVQGDPGYQGQTGFAGKTYTTDDFLREGGFVLLRLLSYAEKRGLIAEVGEPETAEQAELRTMIEGGAITKKSTLRGLAAGAPLAWAMEWEINGDAPSTTTS